MKPLITTTNKAVATAGISLLVYGPYQCGKTHLCRTTGDPEHTLVISVEGGLLALQDVEMPVAVLEDPLQLDALIQQLSRSKSMPYRWICLDSISELAELVLTQELPKHRDERRAFLHMKRRVLNHVRGLRALGANLYMTAKQIDIAEDRDRNPVFTPLLPGNKLDEGIPFLLDGLFAMGEERGERVLITKNAPHYQMLKDRSGLLPPRTPPDLARLRKMMLQRNNPQTSANSDTEPEAQDDPHGSRPCRRCGHDIIQATSPDGQPVFLDAEPTSSGDYTLDPEADDLLAHPISSDDEIPKSTLQFRDHFESCKALTTAARSPERA